MEQYQKLSFIIHELNNSNSIILNFAQIYEMAARRGEVALIPDAYKPQFIKLEVLQQLAPLVSELIALKASKVFLKDSIQKKEEVLKKYKQKASEIYQHIISFEIDLNNLAPAGKKFIVYTRHHLATVLSLLNYYFEDSQMELSSINMYDYINRFSESLLEEEGAHFKFILEADGNETISGNLFALDHILTNLIANAKKHGNASVITVTSNVVDNNIILSVKNDIGPEGKTIPECWLEKIVVSDEEGRLVKEQRLFVFPFTTSKKDKFDHGLGLKVIWAMAKMMGGSVYVESSPKETAFYVVLPKEGSPLSRTGSGSLRLPALRINAFMSASL